MIQNTASPQMRPRSHWYPWIFVAFFATVIGVNIFMVTMAVSSWSGLSTRDHYRKGVAYNQVLDAAEEQASRGWKAEIIAESGLSVWLTDRTGQPLENAAMVAEIRRPGRRDLDQDIALMPQAGGLYRAAIDWGAPGNWDVRIVARLGQTRYVESRRLWLTP
ncbi:MAG: FixH family protein [Alphaproteobacteria bacterium]|nr:FixH family protein [Alphaproteobacteria bacterium]MBU0797166.1 FixH family protein [Alphaproteobacteria bacterium]MBU0887163.1 FixH family protein [Alphaproteobacteria bacterium]MBU1814413.1 FixH family protein [Alphaproteobacteria bacterium]